MEKPKHNRRYFLKSVFAALGIGFVVSWDKMIITHKKIKEQKFFQMSFNTNREITFHNNFVVINKEDKTKVFSSRCTHLGCKIDKSKNDQLLCPCHGSTFDLNGNATKGPAVEPLKELDFEIDELKRRIIVKV